MKKITVVSIIVVIAFSLIAGRSACVRGGKSKTKVGSSNDNDNTFIINAPSNLMGTAISYTQINLSWQYVQGTGSADGFEIERSLNGITYTLLYTLNANTTTYSDFGPFLPFTTYYYRVRAYMTTGDVSSYSNVAEAITVRSEWQAMAAGESHSLAINIDGRLWGWGDNQQGQLDPSNYDPLFTLPTLLNPDTDWSRIGAGYNHTLAIKTNRTLWSWGANESGQLGLGDTENDRYEPEAVGTASDWFNITGGANHTLALKTNGTIWSCGFNRAWDPEEEIFVPGGQLGLGNSIDRNTFTQIGTDSDWATITGGDVHSLAIKTGGTLWAWGFNSNGQLGLGDEDNRYTPTSVGTTSNWMKVSAGGVYTCGLKTNPAGGGTLWAWGGPPPPLTSFPVKVGTDSDWAGISIRQEGSIARKINGTIWEGIYRLTQIGTDSDWFIISSGGYHTLGLKGNGNIWVWGNNNYGQLGLGDTINRNTPTLVGE